MSQVGLYTRLPLPILYGVKHIQEGSGESHVLRISRALRIARGSDSAGHSLPGFRSVVL